MGISRSLFVSLVLLVCWTQSWAATPEQFIAELQAKSPEFDGKALRTYRVEDLNQDKQLEVLEVVNPLEEKSAGFLNSELSPAFEWINIYRKHGERFVLATEQFPTFLKVRRTFYSGWLERFAKPESLDGDSQRLIRANSQEFKKVLDEYVARIDYSLQRAHPNKSLMPTNPEQGGR